MLARVSAVRHLREHVLDLEFSDGVRGQLDFRTWVVGRGGVFTPLENVSVFRQVRIDEDAGTICWPNGVDFCPDVLHHAVSGRPLPGRAPTSELQPS